MSQQTFSRDDRVAYSARFLRGICDYSHASASMRGTVTGVKQHPGMKYPTVGIKWDGIDDPPISGALACNLTLVSMIPADAAG